MGRKGGKTAELFVGDTKIGGDLIEKSFLLTIVLPRVWRQEGSYQVAAYASGQGQNRGSQRERKRKG